MNNLKQAIYETAQDLHNAGIIDDVRMGKYNKLNVPAIHEFKPEEVKQLRLNENVSQSMLAAYLNISVSAIRKWETGEKKPSGLALRLLNLIEKKGLSALSY